jgi:GNAT superfamily N-acetyltransferase
MIGVGVFRYYEKNGTYGRLPALVVDEERRGQGVGASLAAEAERRMKARGVAPIIVDSGKQRSGAHRFYERLEYQETGLRFVKSLMWSGNDRHFRVSKRRVRLRRGTGGFGGCGATAF